MADTYVSGDLIWAKMKGFPAWPGKDGVEVDVLIKFYNQVLSSNSEKSNRRNVLSDVTNMRSQKTVVCVAVRFVTIVDPDSSIIKPKDVKKKYWVFFYGTNDHAWINRCLVWPYHAYLEQFTQKTRISQDLKFALEQIDLSFRNLPEKDKMRQRTLSKVDATDSNDDERSSTSSKKSNGELPVTALKKRGRPPRKPSFAESTASDQSSSASIPQRNRSASGSSAPTPKRAAYQQAIAAVYAQKDEKPRKRAKLGEDLNHSTDDKSGSKSIGRLAIAVGDSAASSPVSGSTKSMSTIDNNKKLLTTKKVTSRKVIGSLNKEKKRIISPKNPKISNARQKASVSVQPTTVTPTSVHLSATSLLTPPRPPARIGLICSPEERNNLLWVHLCQTLTHASNAPTVTVHETSLPNSMLDQNIKNWHRVPTPRLVAQDAEFTICFYPNNHDLFLSETTNSVTGLLASFSDSQSGRRCPSLVILSDIDQTSVDSVVVDISARNGHFLESPLMASGRGDERGYVMIAAGYKPLYDSLESLLTPMTGHKTLYLGGDEALGTPSRLILVLHGLMAVCTAGLAEALALTQRLGLDTETMIQAAELTQVACPLISLRGEAMLNGKFNEDMPLNQQQRHLQSLLSLSDEVTQPLSLAASTNELFKRAKMKGYGDDGTAAVYKAIQRA